MDVFETAWGGPRRAWGWQRLVALGWTAFALGLAMTSAWAALELDHTLHARHMVPISSVSRVAAVPSLRPTPQAHADLVTVAQRAIDTAHRSRSEALHARRAAPAETASETTPAPTDEALWARIHREHVRRALHAQRLPHAAKPWQIGFGLVLLVVATLSLALFYRTAIESHPRAPTVHLPGAFLAALAWVGGSAAFGAYVRDLGSYAVYYGSLAAVAILLVWLFLSSAALLLGFELNLALARRR